MGRRGEGLAVATRRPRAGRDYEPGKAAGAADRDRWPRPWSAGFIFAVSALLWLAVFGVVAALRGAR